ncbi:hypothetical protein [Acinetobacter sp. neg1]|uniref:hypothetical protein n=1 Tax=Acinetobacter sp. neg1 TaxID=1561068 RepID=UPI00064668CE|nr:hypothetical protein [Acinetobacter sp. neg1]
MKNFVKDIILPLLPSALTIIGWWIVGTRDNNSKKNAIHNKRVEAATELIDKILDDAKSFYLQSGSTPAAQSTRSLIISNFKKLSSIINLLLKELNPSDKNSLSSTFIEYKKIVTGGEFETPSRNAVASSNQFYSDIDSFYNELYIELEKTYKI